MVITLKDILIERPNSVKPRITKRKKSGKGLGFKKLFSKFKKKPVETLVPIVNYYQKKYGQSGLNNITAEDYTYTHEEPGNFESVFLSISRNIETNFTGGEVENAKCISIMITLDSTYNKTNNLYQYFDAKFYSNNEFDNLSEVQINQNFTCSVSTLEGISGKCNPPEEMINIIKEKLLPTEAGNDIKQFLQSIGITV